jgi:hypothetical protein
MNIKKYLLAVISTILLFSACKKDDQQLPAPILSITQNQVTTAVNVAYPFVATPTSDAQQFSSEWTLDGKVVSTANFFVFNPNLAGNYVLVYTARNNSGTFSYTYKITVPVPIVATTPSSSKFISKVFEYLPAPGQYVNEATLGSPAQAQKLIGSVSNMVSLGAFGGFITFGFDHSITNQTGADLAIYGNPIGGTYELAEPGIVMVSQDRNGNGLPDDEWYELAGSEYNDPATIKNYEITYKNPKAYANVTWTDNQGKSGTVDINTFHKHNFYPEFAANQESITFKGTLLKSTISKVGSIFTNAAFKWGYTDSWSVGDNYEANRYNSFDISWAVTKDGKPIELKTIDFVKVYTGQNEKGSTLLGEISTEFKGATDLNIK